MLEMIQQSAIPHDKYQLELKLDYQLREGKKTHYRISTYIFIPRSLGITEESYPKAEFYRDVKNYIRIKTPEMRLRDLLDSDDSPLTDIQKRFSLPNWYADQATSQRIVHALRLFGAMFKSSLREHLNLVHRRCFERPQNSARVQNSEGNHIIERAQDTKPVDLADHLIEEFIIQSRNISARYRGFYTDLHLPYVSKEVSSAYLFVDEYISLLIEESATELFDVVSRYYNLEQRSHSLEALGKIVEQELAHRVSRGYGSVLEDKADNETYSFRASVLKKYVSGVLHLSTDAQREGRGIEQVLLALAAGMSMVFATVVAFYFQMKYGAFTLPVFVALVVGYMLKDRIKEIGRMVFAGSLHARLYDRRIKIKTLDGRYKLALLREKIAFLKEKDLPPGVRAARQKDLFADLDNELEGETILCHTKDIVLQGDLFSRAFGGLPKISGLNDIIRYDIHPYLRKMDDPVEKQFFLKKGRLKTVATHKVYHVNVVSCYTSIEPDFEMRYERLRLVLNRKGIKRIEQITL